MKLFYYKHPVGNFGDDLNPLIWYSRHPEFFDSTSPKGLALGIGTLINSRVPVGKKIYVLGSGAGLHEPAVIDENWNFVFVRGPLSARVLGIDERLAITDPAILIATMFAKRPRKRKGIAYMPHLESNRNADWKEICKTLGLIYLDPGADISQNIHAINSVELVLAEAMHAAIVADAMRVPWIPIRAYKHIYDFKWQDWCASLGMEYDPHILPELWDVEQFHSRGDVLKSEIKSLLMSLGVPSTRWTPPLPKNNRDTTFDDILGTLDGIVRSVEPSLSRDANHARALIRVEETLTRFSRSLCD